jgi:hypothetical protein
MNMNHFALNQPSTGTPTRRRKALRRAFTIAEMAVSLLVLSILLVAMGGAITVAARSLPNPGSPVAADLSLSNGLDRMAGELRYAKAVSSSGATFVQFTVADRDSDGLDETIRYDWAGNGQPLMRTYNGGHAAAVSDALKAFSIAFQTTRVTTTQTINSVTDSGEVMFSNCYGWTGLVPLQSSSTLNSTNWATSYFKLDKVTIPATANFVSITKVRVKLKSSATPNGTTMTCGLYNPASAGGPLPGTTQVGSSSTIAVSSLTTSYPAGFNDFAFSDVTFASAPTELNFLVKGTGTSCGSIMYYNNVAAPANNPVWLWSTNSGSAWSPAASSRAANDGYFEIYGTYRAPTTTTVNVDTYYLHNFTLAADTLTPAAHAETTARALNQPTVVP